MSQRPRIAITTSSFATFDRTPLNMLEQAGFTPQLNPLGRKLTAEETVAQVAGCVGVVAGTEPLTEKVLSSCPGLRVVSRCGVGMDNVDQAAAAGLGITVCNTPDGPTRAVAELTLAMALDLLRDVSRMDRELRAGVWKKRMGFALQGKRLGIVGMGRIGQAVAQTFAAMGTSVAYCDPVEAPCCFPRLALNELLMHSDIVCLHCSRPEGICTLLDREALLTMPRGSWLINCSRGGLVDEEALYELLVSGHLAGAGLDVFDREPYQGPLLSLDNVVLTPHIGSYAREGRIQMEIAAVQNALDVLGNHA